MSLRDKKTHVSLHRCEDCEGIINVAILYSNGDTEQRLRTLSLEEATELRDELTRVLENEPA